MTTLLQAAAARRRQLQERFPRVPLFWVAGIALHLIAWPILASTMPNGLPPGILLFGAVFGALYAVTAMGIVLIFRTNRIVNFAQAELGGVAAVVTLQLILVRKWNYFAGVAAGLVLAGIIGAGIDFLIVRRFTKAPRLILTVATIGVAQILQGAALILALITSRTPGIKFPGTPFDFTFRLFPVLFKGDHLVAMIAVPAFAIALGLFLRYTSYGMGIRAAADNGDRASLLGVPTKRLSTVVWAVAGVLSALAVILRAPILGFSFTAVTGGGNALLIRSLGAAVLGRMESLPATAAAAIWIGIVEQVIFFYTKNGTVMDVLIVALILVSLFAQRQRFSRVAETGLTTGSWRAIREVRPIPDELKRLPEVRGGLAVLGLGLAAFALLLPVFSSDGTMQLATYVVIYSIIAVSLVVLTGWAGQISLGQFALVGFGGATTAVLFGRHGVDLFLAMIAGCIVAAFVALLIGLPALRIRGPFLAVTTLGIAVAAYQYFLQDRYFPWFVQEFINRPTLFNRIPLDRPWKLYLFSVTMLVMVLGGVRALRRSRTGRVLIATRDNELAAQAVSINTTKTKLKAFVISGVIAGIAGGLYVLQANGLQPGAFSPAVSIQLFSMVVIGGLGSMPGAILGAMFVRGAQFFLPPGWGFIASGVGILVLLMILPGGLGELLYRIRDALLRLAAKRRGLVVPSLVADVRTAGGEDFDIDMALGSIEDLPHYSGSNGSHAPVKQKELT